LRFEAMDSAPRRISFNSQLGKAGKHVDALLGVAAIVPILAFAGLSLFHSGIPPYVVRATSVIWSAGLLTFFAGVRRGLTFSEAEGGRLVEIATMLLLFIWGIASMVSCSPMVAACGFIVVGILDLLVARRGEAPSYFIIFRPLQMLVGAIALVVVQLDTV
jgi:hypothetical protein